MSTKSSILVLFLLGIVLFSCSSPANDKQKFTQAESPEVVGISSERLARLDSFIQKNIDKQKLPNTATFIAINGKIVHHKAFGWKDKEKGIKLSKDDIFRNASQTKAVTSVALMILFEKGYFLLNDHVSKYIPEFANPQVLVTLNEKDSTFTSRPAKSEITIKQLLAHTSGITYENLYYTKAKIPYVNSLDPVTLKDIIPKLAKLPIKHDPGVAFTYGLNTYVVGYLVEVLSAMPLDKFMKENIFDPIGMNDTHFYLPKEKHDRLVKLYAIDGSDSIISLSKNIQNSTYPIAGAQTYFSGGAGLEGTIEDYAKFCQMLLNGGSFNNKQILGRKTVDIMTTNQIGDLNIWGNENKFGLGFELITEKGTSSLPGSVGTFKWGGMYRTDYTIDPKEDMVALFYTNVNPNRHWDFNSLNRILLYQSLVGPRK
jgi:CubicO group peptidase (beta-lactamase class C family)